MQEGGEMKGKEIVLAVATMVIVLAMIPLAGASPGAAITLNPSDVRDLDPGATFTVDVRIAEAVNVYGWQVNLTFTPGVLSVSEVTEGTFFDEFDETVWPVPRIENGRGFVLFSASLWPPYPAEGANGNGLLATVNFRVESGASSDLHFDSEGTYLRTFGGGQLIEIDDFTVQDGGFTGTGVTWWSQLPWMLIAGVVIVVVLVVVTAVFLLRRRRQ
jgi:hypothetical protein